jgi:hypothetical protein
MGRVALQEHIVVPPELDLATLGVYNLNGPVFQLIVVLTVPAIHISRVVSGKCDDEIAHPLAIDASLSGGKILVVAAELVLSAVGASLAPGGGGGAGLVGRIPDVSDCVFDRVRDITILLIGRQRRR